MQYLRRHLEKMRREMIHNRIEKLQNPIYGQGVCYKRGTFADRYLESYYKDLFKKLDKRFPTQGYLFQESMDKKNISPIFVANILEDDSDL